MCYQYERYFISIDRDDERCELIVILLLQLTVDKSYFILLPIKFDVSTFDGKFPLGIKRIQVTLAAKGSNPNKIQNELYSNCKELKRTQFIKR